MDREDIQSRRAANQVWNGAENYDVRPEFQAYDADGEAQLYMNTIIGLVYRSYQFDKFKPLFHAFQHQQKGELYSDLFWLGLEGVAYEKALKERPVLEELRQGLAERDIKFGWDSGVLRLAASEAYGHKSGARDLRNVLRRRVEDPICARD